MFFSMIKKIFYADFKAGTKTTIKHNQCSKIISEYIRCNIFTEWISTYIGTPEIAQIQIQILKCHFIRIIKYS